VLAWIRQPPREFNVFVSNRIAKIQEMTKEMTWHHVATNLNPADVVSRGCTPRELLEHSLWVNGPPFLLQSSSSWPSLLDSVKDLSERRSVALIGSVRIDSSSNCKFLNSFDKLQRVFAYIYRFISNCRAKSSPFKGRLSVEEINSGTGLLLRSIQQVNLAKEFGSLSQGKPFPQKSKLVSLRPILGSERKLGLRYEASDTVAQGSSSHQGDHRLLSLEIFAWRLAGAACRNTEKSELAELKELFLSEQHTASISSVC